MYFSLTKPQRRPSRLPKFLLGVLFFTIVFALLGYFLIQSNLFKVTRVIVTTNDELTTNIISSLQARTPFFFTAVDDIERELSLQFLRIETFDVRLDILAHTLTVSYSLREPHFLWCTEDCYFVDTQGIIFQKSDIIENTFLITIHDNYFQEVSVGKRIPLRYILALVSIQEAFARNELALTSFTLNAPFALFAETKQGGEARFTLQKPIGSQIENLFTFISSHSQEELANFQYIDLRIEDRIYYKKND